MMAKKGDSDRGRRDRFENDSRDRARPAGGQRPDRKPKSGAGPKPDTRTGTRKPPRGPRTQDDEAREWDGEPGSGDRPGRGSQSGPGPKANRGPRPDAGKKPGRDRKRSVDDGAGRGPRRAPRDAAGRGAKPGAEAAVVGVAAATVGVAAGRRVETPALAKDGRDFIYGRHAVLEMLRAGRRHVHNVWLGEGVQQTGIVAEVLSTARLRGIPVKEMSRVGFERLGPVNHQGVVAEVEAYPYVELDELLRGELAEDALFLALDHLQDVQNLGTLLRTAEAMNVTGVILPERRAAEITPAAVNASAGAVEHLRIARVGNLVQALEQLKAAGVWIAGLDSGPGATPLGRADLAGRLALVVGAEGEGLARLAREKCDWLVAIPMYGKVGSLNAAVAGSVALITARQMQRSRE
jgi:23S rRNA (guanosine2251-2'-O)-methyltransferase